jgi:hypothetical protein
MTDYFITFIAGVLVGALARSNPRHSGSRVYGGTIYNPMPPELRGLPKPPPPPRPPPRRATS